MSEINNNTDKDLEFPYLAVIPYKILADDDLCPNAKILFGCLTGLAKKHGYCWASNEQLAGMAKVEVRQIQRWLLTLEKKEHIRKRIVNNPYKNEEGKLRWRTDRKIYVNDGFSNNVCGDDKKDMPNGGDKKDTPNEGDKKDTQKEKPLNKKPLKENTSHDSGKASVPLSEHAFRLVDLLHSKIKNEDSNTKSPNRKNWATVFDRMNRLDKRSWEEIEQLINFAHDDVFWSANILSPTKLREQATQLLLKMKRSTKKSDAEDKHFIAEKNKEACGQYIRKNSLKPFQVRREDFHVNVRSGNGWTPIGYAEKGFEEQFKNALRKGGHI